jgi:anti-sigma regulatory factor (Ser/Thr protein kinase)
MASLLVPHEPPSAAAVRQALWQDLSDHGVDPESVDTVVLIASELLGNAIRHTEIERVGLRVSWELEAASVRVEVADHSTTTPCPRPPRPTEPGGRGLTIVDALAYEWGFDRIESGKRVWARVPVRVGAPA